MSAFLVDLTEESPTSKQAARQKQHQQIAKPTKQAMSSDELLHLIAEIEKRQNSDAKACLNLLKLISESST